MSPGDAANVYLRREQVHDAPEPHAVDRWWASMSREPRFVAIGPAAGVATGEMREYVVEDVELVVVNLDGELTAFANRCPHQGGPLGRGKLQDGVIWCPWHSPASRSARSGGSGGNDRRGAARRVSS
jgi:nitrite reductase (NADH) small subunit